MSSLNQGPVSALSGTTLVSTKTPLTGSTPATATVGITSAQAVASNTSRKGMVIVNTSANKVSFALGSNTAVLNNGVTLAPNGVWTMDEYTYSTQAINAIASSAGSVISIQEFI